MQIRGAQVLDAAKIYKQGYPFSMTLEEFIRRFSLLIGDSNQTNTISGQKAIIENITGSVDLDASLYRIGSSKVSQINQN